MPTQTVYIQSVKKPELKYEVLDYDDATKTATLKGERGHFKITPFTPTKVKADGYRLVKEEAPDGTGSSGK